MSENNNSFFYGRCQNKLSPKGQVAIPKRFRSVLSEEESQQGFVLIPGQDNCIYMYTHRQFGVIRENVRNIALSENDPEFFRSFMEEASPVDLDTQGRFVIPAALREYAQIKGNEILFIGMDDRIELWEATVRESQRPQEQDYRQMRKQKAKDIFGI